MMSRISLLIVLGSIFFSLSSAFVPAAKGHVSFQPARLVHGAKQLPSRQLVLRTSEETESEEAPVAEKKASPPTTGTFYDDEVDPIPATKIGISESMRERLVREASTGLDSDSKQTNVLLYIMIGVAVLVIAGGQGILY